MADAGAGGHDAEVVEGGRAPAQEVVALDIAFVFAVDILAGAVGVAEIVDHDRVVDDKIDGVQRVDLRRIGAQLDHGVAHRGQVDDGRHAGKVLHQHARGAEADFMLDRALVDEPVGQGGNVFLGNRDAVFEAQQVFQQDLQRGRQGGDALQTIGFGRLEIVVGVGFIADRKGRFRLEAVDG